MKHPWSKFYWADWRSDPRLRMCGLAARGLWIEMLALMNEATPFGHLLVNGRPPTDAQLAVLVGAPQEQIPDLLGELETSGVFSRTQKGTIYSRRMTRDDKRARVARENGKNGGNPSLSKHNDISASDNQQDKGEVNTQRLDARDQRIESKKDPPASLPPKGEVLPKPRGSRLPSDFEVPAEWISEGADLRERHGLPPADLDTEAARFPLYWTAVAGAKGTKVDWRKTWLNRCLDIKGSTNGQFQAGRKLTPVESLYAGAALAIADRERAREQDQRRADSGAGDDAPIALLDSRRCAGS